MGWHYSQHLRFTPEPQVNPVSMVVPDWTLTLDDTKDYVLSLGSAVRTKPVAIVGGRHVRLIGGEINVNGARALLLKNQMGSAYVEGLKFGGFNVNGDSIGLDQSKGARVTIQNCDGGVITGTFDGWHADLIQTWNGPRRLEIDRFQGYSTYQGIFLRPTDFGLPCELVDISRVYLNLEQGNYALWREPAFPVYVNEVWVKSPKGRDEFLWPKGDPVWANVKQGVPPASFISPDVGIGYRSKWV